MGTARRQRDEFRAGKKTDEASVGTATTASSPPSSRGELTVASVETLPSVAIDNAGSKVAKNLKLSDAEEQELKRMEKRLREIAKLEAKGIEHLDKLQLSKI